MDPYATSLLVYNLLLQPMIFVSVLFLILAMISLTCSLKKDEDEKVIEPFVSVQVPTYNDPIGARCVQKCLEFDYPKEKYEVIIADDSTNKDTQELLKAFADKYPERVKYIHRDNRSGYKPGALINAMKDTKGEIIAIFDSDWIPKPDFIRTIVKPFADEKVAIVQSRQGFYNHDTNLITRFASYLLTIYHTLVMPINNKINCVFFCGTAGALRRSAVDDAGGWNASSVTEDSDLSVRLLLKGYKSVYLDYETPSEVPDTFESFLVQQMRWAYGNTRVFLDHWKKILFGKGLSIWQRLMIMWITLLNGTSFIVIMMTLAGLSGWFLGDVKLISIQDFRILFWNFFITGGFLVCGFFTFVKRRQLKEIPYFIVSSMTIGLLHSGTTCIAFTKAVLNKPLFWKCTPKTANAGLVADESNRDN